MLGSLDAVDVLDVMEELMDVVETRQLSPHAAALMSSMPESSWVVVHRTTGVLATARGSHTGVPLADIVFVIIAISQ